MSIKIKDFSVLEQLLVCSYHSKLIEVLQWFCTTYEKVTFTCGHRSGDVGVHGTLPCRAVDLRSLDYENPKSVEEQTNKVWTYDLTRPDMKVAFLHDVGSGMHFHIQVHDRTRRR